MGLPKTQHSLSCQCQVRLLRYYFWDHLRSIVGPLVFLYRLLRRLKVFSWLCGFLWNNGTIFLFCGPLSAQCTLVDAVIQHMMIYLLRELGDSLELQDPFRAALSCPGSWLNLESKAQNIGSPLRYWYPLCQLVWYPRLSLNTQEVSSTSN